MAIHAGRKNAKIVPICPNCFSNEHVVQIMYGYPTDELIRSGREDFVLGGCMLGPDSPGWFCQGCKHDFGEVRAFPSE